MAKENIVFPEKTKKKGKETSKNEKNLNTKNKRLRKELKEQKKIDEQKFNIYDVNSQKEVDRRFNTIHNQLNQFDEDTQKFIKNLEKKFDQTTTYFKNP